MKLASAASDGAVYVWRLPDVIPIGSLDRHTDAYRRRPPNCSTSRSRWRRRAPRDRGAMRTEPRIPAPDPVRAEQGVPFLLARVRGRSWLARCVSQLARCGLLRIYQTPVANPMRN